MAHAAIHETVVGILSALPPGRLLDVPAGEGALAARLLPVGFQVECCDLYPEIFCLQGVAIRRGDLTGVLPYDDATFDYVACLEGLEHLENPHQPIREFRRLLKPGGHLIVSLPNILNIEERMKWLVHGYTSHFKPLSPAQVEIAREKSPGREEVALHVNPIAYSELRYILEKQGFRIVQTCRDAPKRRLWLYWPLVTFIRVIARLTPEQKRRERWTEELQSDPVLLGGNTLIMHCIRQ